MRKTTIISIILSISLVSCSGLFNSYKSEIDGVYIPKNLEDAISEVNGFYPDSLKTEIRKLSENEFVGQYHMGTGLYMRNNWNLWGGSRLSKYFKRKGIKHPDDMSGIILTSFHRRLTGKEINFREQVSEYKEYWKESKKLHSFAKLPRQSKYPADGLEFGYMMWFENKNKPSLLHLQTNSTTDSLWIFEYQYGWKKITKETAEKLKHPKHKTDSILNLIYKE